MEEANRQIEWLRVQLDYLWDYLIEQDLHGDAQDYIAEKERYQDHAGKCSKCGQAFLHMPPESKIICETCDPYMNP